MNVTLPQNSQGKGVTAIEPAAPFQVLLFPYTDKASHDGGDPGQGTGRLAVSCHLVPTQFRTWDLWPRSFSLIIATPSDSLVFTVSYGNLLGGGGAGLNLQL